MRKYSIQVFLGLLFILFPFTVNAQTNSHLKFFGYYNLDGLPPSIPGLIDIAKARQPNFNIGLIMADLDKTHMAGILQKFKNHSVKAIINVQWVFAKSITNNETLIDSQWTQRWQTFKETTGGYEDLIYGYYFDEPLWNGFPKEDFRTITRYIRQDAPDKSVMVVEAKPTLANFDKDYFQFVTDMGFDYYTNDFPKYVEAFNRFLYVSRGKNLWVIPQGFTQQDIDTARLIKLTDSYYQVALSHNEVVGMLFFLYPNPHEVGINITLQDLFDSQKQQFYSQNLLEIHKSIGRQIINRDYLSGDLNDDSRVDIFDYNLLITDFGKTGDMVSDIDVNQKVDIFDYNILVANFGKSI